MRVVKANRDMASAMNTGPMSPRVLCRAACTKGAPASSAVGATSELRHMRAVAEQISRVSRNTDSICTRPCLAGWDTSAVAAALGAEHRAGRWAMLMLYAGLRRGEALALRWEDIDWEHNIIHVRRALHFEGGNPVLGATKTDCSVRDVPMFPVLRRCLQIHEASEEYVCVSAEDTAWKTAWAAFNNTMANILNGDTAKPVAPGRRSDLDDENRKAFSVRAHDLRHTFCSLLYDAGVDVLTAQKMMGHSNPEITMCIYTHLSEEKKENDIEKATAYLERMTAGF